MEPSTEAVAQGTARESATPAVATDAEYDQVLRRASWLGGHGREKAGKQPLVSFPSLVLALGGGGSETLDWFKATLRELAPQWVGRAYLGWKNQETSTPTFPPELTVEHIRRPPALASDLPAPVDRTPSAEDIEKRAAAVAAGTCGAVRVRELLVPTLLAAE